MIQELGRYLRACCHRDQHSWSCFLLWDECAQNSFHQNSTGLTPFQCMLGHQLPLFPWSGELSEVPAVDYWFRESERVWDSAHTHVQWAVRRQKRFADARRAATPNYHPGQKVWLSTRDLRLRLPCQNLSPHFIGPFRIQRQINEVTYQLHLAPRYRIHPTFHVSLLKPFSPSSSEPREPDEPEILDQPSIYQVENILDSQWRGSRLEYLVDWEGYGPKERALVVRDNILHPMLLEDFHRNHPTHPAPRGRGRPRLRASGASPGGGGNVRDVKLPQTSPSSQSSTTTYTRSHSPVF